MLFSASLHHSITTPLRHIVTILKTLRLPAYRQAGAQGDIHHKILIFNISRKYFMKRAKRLIAFLVLVTLGLLIYFNYPKLDLLTGFAAKNLCSCTFVAGMTPEEIEVGDNEFFPVSLASGEIDEEERSATATFFGLNPRKAIFRDGLGCVLLPEGASSKEVVLRQPLRKKNISEATFPLGSSARKDTVFPEIDQKALENAISEAFSEEKRTRAVVVLYKGSLVVEKYAPGITRDTRMPGWSMTKSITNAVLGVLHKQGKISLAENALFDRWKDDPRAAITLNNLLRMNSGLEWEEDYTEISDVTKMLFLAGDMSEVQLVQPLVGIPGETWNYSSGITNLLSAYIRKQFSSQQEYLDFWHREFIDKIGMHSVILETDLAGNYVGSSYAWATGRDWAKFGQFFLNKGEWNGEEVLSEEWVEYSVMPAPGSEGKYGAHFWLNAGGTFPNVPRDMFSANGFKGQYVFIIPSEELVVVRLGLKDTPEFDVDLFLSGIIEAVEEI